VISSRSSRSGQCERESSHVATLRRDHDNAIVFIDSGTNNVVIATQVVSILSFPFACV